MIENDIIKLRALEPSDIESLYKWENDTSIWMVSNTLVPFSKYILKKYIENSHHDIYESKQLRLMIDAKITSKGIKVHDTVQLSMPGLRPVGCIDLFDFDPYHNRAGIGILINSTEDRRKGYASEALKILIDYAFRVLKLHQLYCNISSDNTPSINLFEKYGFKLIGNKKGWLKAADGWIDEFLLQLINPYKK